MVVQKFVQFNGFSHFWHSNALDFCFIFHFFQQVIQSQFINFIIYQMHSIKDFVRHTSYSKFD